MNIVHFLWAFSAKDLMGSCVNHSCLFTLYSNIFADTWYTNFILTILREANKNCNCELVEPEKKTNLHCNSFAAANQYIQWIRKFVYFISHLSWIFGMNNERSAWMDQCTHIFCSRSQNEQKQNWPCVCKFIDYYYMRAVCVCVCVRIQTHHNHEITASMKAESREHLLRLKSRGRGEWCIKWIHGAMPIYSCSCCMLSPPLMMFGVCLSHSKSLKIHNFIAMYAINLCTRDQSSFIARARPRTTWFPHSKLLSINFVRMQYINDC